MPVWPYPMTHVSTPTTDTLITHTTQEERLTALLDDNDAAYWNYSDALDEAVNDLDELHRILRDAMRAAAQSGYDLATRERTR